MKTPLENRIARVQKEPLDRTFKGSKEATKWEEVTEEKQKCLQEKGDDVRVAALETKKTGGKVEYGNKETEKRVRRGVDEERKKKKKEQKKGWKKEKRRAVLI